MCALRPVHAPLSILTHMAKYFMSLKALAMSVAEMSSEKLLELAMRSISNRARSTGMVLAKIG